MIIPCNIASIAGKQSDIFSLSSANLSFRKSFIHEGKQSFEGFGSAHQSARPGTRAIFISTMETAFGCTF